MDNEATNIYVESGKKHLFEALKQALSSDGGRVENLDAFLFAATFGFNQKQAAELQGKENYIKTNYVDPPERALIAAMALSEAEDKSRPPSMNESFAIAERHANAGIELLQGKLADIEVFRHWLNAEVLAASGTLEPQWPFDSDEQSETK